MKTKIDIVKVVKIIGLGFTVLGTVATAWAGDKSNTETLEKLVTERLEKN